MWCLLQGGSGRKGSGDSVRVNGSLRDMSPLTSVRSGSGRDKLGLGREVSGSLVCSNCLCRSGGLAMNLLGELLKIKFTGVYG